MVFIVDPNEYIFPLIQSWPTPSETAETLILRKDGDSVLFINELCHRNNTVLELTVPLSDEEITAVQAVLGYEGIFEGKDYRGEDVLADINKIPDTPWYMVAKVDQSEIYSKLLYRTVFIFGFISLLIFLLSIGLVSIHNYRQADTYQELYLKEKELREAQEEFRTALYNIGDGVITTDKEGLVTHVNRVAETLIGMCETDAKGKPIDDVFKIVDEDTQTEIENLVQMVLRELGVVGLLNHTLLLLRSGLEIPIMTKGAPIINEDNEITGVVLVFRDETEERKHKKTLRKSEEKYRKFFEEDLTGDYIATPEGKILLCNPAFAKIFGFESVEEILKTPIWKLYKSSSGRKAFLHLLNKKKRLDMYELELIRKDGEKINIVENAIGVFDEKGKLVQIKGYLFDITERKQAEEEILNSRERLRKLSSHLQSIREDERGNIAREIHDDLGQSLTALKMDMSWFKKHLNDGDDSSDKKIKGMIELVDATIKSVQRISTELRPAVLDDLGFSSAVKWFMSEFEERSGLKCKLEIKPDNIVLDEKLSIAMYRIFQESLTNIMRHAKATEVKVNIKLIKNELSLVVEDNGVGIDEEKLKDSKSIGLIGMQERVYPWKGTVEITGEKGKGTIVQVNVKL
ncbi:MAG: PAS domain S-box protein [Ignavibacteria bacterium]|nr:PAS domain S-box protein [Ignavibacteria bacterium]